MRVGILFFALAASLIAGSAPAWAQEATRAPAQWEQSIVGIEVVRKQYDYFQPWSKRTRNSSKTGIVLAGNEILTTADDMFDRTLVRVQKGGRGKWWAGRVEWIDYHANLAIVKAEDPAFWQGLAPVELADAESVDNYYLIRWRMGNLETRRVEFNQFRVDLAHLSFIPQVQLEVGSEMKGIGWGEPITAGGKVAAIAAEQTDGTCIAIPAGFVRPILEARKKGAYPGLGYFDFYWQPAQNPASLEHLGLEGEPRGVIITEVPAKPGFKSPLKARDVILEIDGFEIDIEGDYLDPRFGHLSLENLSTRAKWAGDTVKMKIWRDRKLTEIDYVLPKADFAANMVPDAVFDQEPEYLIAGGLVFQPLTDAYLQGWGADWKRRAPFRLLYYKNQYPTEERPGIVFLAQVLPDPYNVGYHELRHLIVEEVNGKKISRLNELKEALKTPEGKVHRIKFAASDSLRQMVIAAGSLDEATRRILQRYGISSEAYIAETAPAENDQASVAAKTK